MFDLPASKRCACSPTILIFPLKANEGIRIRRADLRDRSRSPASLQSSTRSSPDIELQRQAQARFEALYGDCGVPIASTNSDRKYDSVSNQEGDDGAKDEEDQQSFDFRLFSTRTGEERSQKIVLEAEEEDNGDGGFLRRERDKSYYFTTIATGERKAGIESMAVSGEKILQWRNTRARGLEVPWRVKTIRVHISSRPKLDARMVKVTGPSEAQETKDVENKKCKPGKKRRLILREKRRTKEKAEEEMRKRNEGREEAEREKRTRRNREKKVKRKIKEKAKKAEATGDTKEDASVNITEGEE